MKNDVKLNRIRFAIEKEWNETYSDGSIIKFNEFLNSLKDIKSFTGKYVGGSSLVIAYTIHNCDKIHLIELAY